jgi:hypothetical protein
MLEETDRTSAAVSIGDGRGSYLDIRQQGPAIVLNETLARRLWPGQSPIGHAVRFAGTMREIIGVVRDGKYRSLDEPPTVFAFIPFAQRYSAQMTVHVRARGDAAAALAALEDEVRALDPNIAVDRARLLADDIALYSLIQRVAAWAVGCLASSAWCWRR